MGIRDDLRNADRTPKTFDAWKLIADEDDVAAVEEACADLSLSTSAVIAICKRNGIPLSKETVGRYR